MKDAMSLERAICNEKMVELGLIYKLDKYPEFSNNIYALSDFLLKLANEKYEISLMQHELKISPSLSIPLEVLASEMLTSLLGVLQGEHNTDVDVNESGEFALKYDLGIQKRIGDITMLCGFFLMLKKVYVEISDIHLVPFEFVKQKILNERNISLDDLLPALQKCGY